LADSHIFCPHYDVLKRYSGKRGALAIAQKIIKSVDIRIRLPQPKGFAMMYKNKKPANFKSSGFFNYLI
tara:strand:- start:130 stop:336 length:207 start_codon:yes stop_codon:yes gene_type:complete